MVWQEQQVVAPWNIVNMLPSLSLHRAFGEQHDAHEFFCLLMNKMQQSCLPTNTNIYQISQDYNPFVYPFQ